jgi:hypothetical protein
LTLHANSNVSVYAVHLSQEAYANQIIEAMELSDAATSPTMTPYQSGLPMADAIPPVNMPDSECASLLSAYHCYLGMLHWLTISTCPDLRMTAHSLLAIATAKPMQGHLDAIHYIGMYIKETADYGISFCSCKNNSLESFITFQLNDTKPTRPTPTAFINTNWGPQDVSVPSPKNLHQVSFMKYALFLGTLFFFLMAPLSENVKKSFTPLGVLVKPKSKPWTNV